VIGVNAKHDAKMNDILEILSCYHRVGNIGGTGAS
jgi:hypothetical protein